MASEDAKILEFNQYRKSDKTPSINYADPESLIKRIDVCQSNSEKLFTRKLAEHITCGYPVSTKQTFNGIEKRHDVYMKMFCQSLREHAMKITNFEMKKKRGLSLSWEIQRCCT